MENVGQYSSTLVYPSPTSRTHDTPDNHPVNASSSWLQNHKPSAGSPGAHNQPTPVYPVVDRSADHENYASPPASASYGSMHSADQFSNYPQSPSVRTTDEAHSLAGMNLASQVSGSVGPDRVTRRQARTHSSLHLGIRRDRPPQADVQNGQHDGDEQSTYFMSPASAISRPQTPTHCPDSARYQQQTDRSSMYSIPPSNGTGGMPLQSPRYLPTPVSGSPYSPFSLFPAHSRSTSSYSTSNPRSTSPALSAASALTSISSSNSTPNTQTFAAYPLPSPPGGPVVQRAKQRKQRLFNVDRKAICVYHQENPNARQEDIAARYGVERSTISKILKHKTKWMNVPEDDDMRVAKHRPSKFPEVEEELVNWLVQMKQQNTLLTDALIRSKAKETARNLQIPEERFKASSGWVENFKHRHNIRKGVWLGHTKGLRATRGIGATHLRKGSNESALSPLNPAFESRSEALARRESTNTADEDDMESEDDQDLDASHSGQPVPGSSHSQPTEASVSHHPLPPIWTMHHEPLSSNETPISASGSQPSVVPQHPFSSHEDQHHDPAVTNVHQNPISLPAQQHMSVPQSQQDVELSGHGDAPATYPAPVVVYQIAPITSSGDTIPDISEAEEAINKVIHFVDTQSPSILTPDERDVLAHIKNALFQAASGVPYVRERR